MKTSAVLLAVISGAIALAGCVATKYEKAAQDTPLPVLLNLAAAQAPIELELRTVIVYNGPGSFLSLLGMIELHQPPISSSAAG
jgi:hypothetical protein